MKNAGDKQPGKRSSQKESKLPAQEMPPDATGELTQAEKAAFDRLEGPGFVERLLSGKVEADLESRKKGRRRK